MSESLKEHIDDTLFSILSRLDFLEKRLELIERFKIPESIVANMSACYPFKNESKECDTKDHMSLNERFEDLKKRLTELESLIENIKKSTSYNHLNLCDACKRIEEIEKQVNFDKERITYVNDLVIKVQDKIDNLEVHKNYQVDENRKISRRVDKLETDKNKEEYKIDKIVNKQLKEEKKTGLSFEEAFIELKKGKKIKIKSYDFSLEYIKEDDKIWQVGGSNDKKPLYCAFNEYVLSNDWEIVE